MILGRVDSNLQACVQLPLVLDDGRIEYCEPVVDSGFTGELILPSTVLEQVGATFVGSSLYQLADGSKVTLPRFEVIILWHDTPRKIQVVGSEEESLLGMELLAKSSITIDVEIGGEVRILPLSL